MALEVARMADCCALVAVAPAYEDGNYDEASAFKTSLKQLVRGGVSFVLDIHGMKNGPQDVVVGTAGGKAPAGLVGYVAEMARAAGLSVKIADRGRLSADRDTTITSYGLVELDVPAVQIELASDLRDPAREPERYERACKFLEEAARWA
jgi:hypothetical protein